MYLNQIKKEGKRGPGLTITHFFNNKQALMKNVTLQDLTAKFPHILLFCIEE